MIIFYIIYFQIVCQKIIVFNLCLKIKKFLVDDFSEKSDEIKFSKKKEISSYISQRKTGSTFLHHFFALKFFYSIFCFFRPILQKTVF